MKSVSWTFFGVVIGIVAGSMLLIPHNKSEVLGTHTQITPTPTVTPTISPYK